MNKAKARAQRILGVLKENYPNSKISLNYSNNFELLVAVMLSAQTTDAAVNKVTKKLFLKYRGSSEGEEIKNFANVNIKTLENEIKSIGLFRTKAKNVKKSAQILLKIFKGKISNNMSDLLNLPGVGRKTANVVLANTNGIVEGIAVDTHVKRLAKELGLTKEINPEKIERDLMKFYDKKDWPILTYYFIAHGRKKDKKVDLLLRKIKV